MSSSESMLYLKVRVQSLETGLFLTRQGEWIDPAQRKRRQLKMGAVEAIKLCVRLGLKSVKFTATTAKGAELTEYPFGMEQRALREGIQANGRLRQQQRILAFDVDAVGAEAKERKKQVPFNRKPMERSRSSPGLIV